MWATDIGHIVFVGALIALLAVIAFILIQRATYNANDESIRRFLKQ